jgi:hypothetical protein
VLGENTTAGWRTELWVRCDGMGDGLRRRFAAQRSLSESDVEDVWSALLTRVVQAPGPGTLPADADRWPDRQLRKWLTTAFEREIWRAAQRNVTSDGILRHSPLDALTDGVHARGLLARDAAPAGPEAEMFGRLDALEYVSGIEDVAGPEAARLLLADAIGASPAEQQQLLGIKTRSPYQTLRGRLEIAGNAMSRRVQAVVFWFFPDSVLRWLGPLTSGGPVPRIGAVGLAVTALAAGGVGLSTATHHPLRRARPIKPVAAATAAAPIHAAAAPLRAIVNREQQTQRRATARAQTHKRVAAQRRVIVARQRRAATRRKTVAAAKATAQRQFSAQPITASPSSATTTRTSSSAPSASSSDRSTADNQFGLGG